MGIDAGALLAEARQAAIGGWDFSWLEGRLETTGPGWDFGALVDRACVRATGLLDLGTGGGEYLAARAHRPAVTVAAESWPPNVRVARDRLAPLGVAIVRTEPAPDNRDHDPAGAEPVGPAPGGPEPTGTGRLPFRSASLDLVTARHEAFVAGEVARVLRPGGRFLTQQASSGTDQWHRLLGLIPVRRAALDLDLLLGQVMAAGLEVDDAGSGAETLRFADIGALAWYLRMVPWAVPGFDVDRDHTALLAAAHRPLVVRQEWYWLSARQPA